MNLASNTALIGLDWGTTSLRALRFGPTGEVLERRQSSHGITQLPQAGEAGFAQALAQIAGDWLVAAPKAPVVACGMVGSAQGWAEAAYLPLPANVSQLANACTRVSLAPVAQALGLIDSADWAHRQLFILPGLIERGSALPNVMRGEETQIFGALLEPDAPSDLLMLLPGTHSKWVRVRNQVVTHFDTFMTGEVFAALRAHTILGRTMAPSEGFSVEAFARGVQVAGTPQAANGVLSTIFSTRTLGLEGLLPASEQADYLSGLLIGHEVQAICAQLAQTQALAEVECWLIGSDSLCQRYISALECFGIERTRTLPQATERGLWSLATANGLIAG